MVLKVKKKPYRMCVACRENVEKKELIRIVRINENELEVDETGKMSGRGAYICPKIECLDKARKINSLGRALNVSMTDELYNKIKRVILRRGL